MLTITMWTEGRPAHHCHLWFIRALLHATSSSSTYRQWLSHTESEWRVARMRRRIWRRDEFSWRFTATANSLQELSGLSPLLLRILVHHLGKKYPNVTTWLVKSHLQANNRLLRLWRDRWSLGVTHNLASSNARLVFDVNKQTRIQCACSFP